MTPSAPVRTTRQRRAVSSILGELDAFASAQEIHDRLRHSGEAVGLSTVYRNLQALADAGEVDALRNEDGEVLYRRCSTEHHHHLVCRDCGSTVEVEGPAVESWAEKTAHAHGFVEVSHTVELTGVCADCAR